MDEDALDDANNRIVSGFELQMNQNNRDQLEPTNYNDLADHLEIHRQEANQPFGILQRMSHALGPISGDLNPMNHAHGPMSGDLNPMPDDPNNWNNHNFSFSHGKAPIAARFHKRTKSINDNQLPHEPILKFKIKS